MDNSKFGICVKDCQMYFELDCSDQQSLQQGDLLQIFEEDSGVSTVNLFNINYASKDISFIDKRFLCEAKYLQSVSLKLFRFLVSEEVPTGRFQLLIKSEVLCKLNKRSEIELDKSFLKYFHNIVCQVLYIGEVPELGVGDFIGIKLMNCVLPLMMVGSQKQYATKYIGDSNDSLLITARDLIKYFIKEIPKPVAILPSQPIIYSCSKCKTSDHIIHLRECLHKLCKDCLIEKFKDRQTLELSCGYRMSKAQQCSKIINLEHFMFFYPELQDIYNDVMDKNRKSCYKCTKKLDIGNVVKLTDCEHFLCKQCALDSVKDESIVKEYCQFWMNNGDECKMPFEQKYLKLIMSGVELAAYEDRKLAHILKTMPNSRQCKTLKCKNYFIVKDDSCTRYQCQSCKNFNCLKCDAVHNSSCQVYQRQILDGADEAKKTALLAKLSKEEIAIHDLVRKETVESYSEAEKFLVLRAKYENYKDSDLVWAIRQSNEMSVIERSLNIECNFCNETFSHNNIFGMITCEHTFCMDCAKTYFTIQIKEKTIRDCICPTCKLPDLNNSSDEDEYFSLMGALLKNILDENIYDLFDRKTRDRALRVELAAYEDRKLAHILKTMPNSRQCKTLKCKNYFIVKDDSCTRYQCQSCKNFNCLKCDAVHNSSCQVYQRQILDGADEAKKTALLAKLSKEEIAIHDLVRKETVESYSEAEKFLVLRAKYENYKDSDLVWAIRQSNEMSVIERSLNIECNFCNETFSHNNIFGMITCEHTFCMDCAKTHFTIQIKEKTIRDCICPTCKLPDLNNSSDEDEYFSLMGALLKNILDENIYDLFDRKTRDRALRVELAAYEDRKLAHILKTMPNSPQCKTLKCKNYFIVKDDSCTRYQCQSCKNFNCLKCDAVHNSSCQVYQRQILDGADEAKKTALLAKLSKEEIAIHDLVRKGTVESYSEAEKFLVLRAKYENYKDSDLVWAIRQSNEMSVIERSLNIECNFCNETFSHNNIFGMITCEHTFCMDCAKTYFTIQIKEKTIRDCICPTCKLPDLNNSSDEDEYFSLMGALLKNILDENIYDLFDRKTRDRALRVELAAYEDRKLAHILKTMPNSRQCKTLKCKNYFIVKDDSCTRYQCQSCKNFNCLKCDAVHNSSCQVYQRQILDGADEAKKTALLAKLSKEEIAIHDLVRKGTVESYSEAEKFLVLRAKYENYKDSDLVWAIRQSNEMSVIERSLNIECNFCNETFSHNNIFGMITCEHTFCMDCAKTYFTIQIKEKTIRDCICPTCKLPDLNNSSDEDEYFSLMDALLKNILDENIYDLFDRKTRDRALRVELAAYEDRKLAHILKTMPNSRQCKTLKCKNYFIVKDDSCTRYQCQSCKNFNCLKCDAVHNSSCQVYQRQILDGADEAKKTALLAKLSKEEIAIHDLVRKGTVESYSEAEKFLVLRAKYENYKDSDLVWAIRQSNEMSVIERSLNIECNFCNETFSHNNIFGMITCEHTFCMDCAKTYFTIQIKEKTIRDCICPTCKLPDLNNSSDEDEYFSLMGALLKNILDENIYDLFDRKTRDRALRVELAAYEDRKLAHILKTMPNSRQCKTLKCKNYFIVKDDSCTRYQCQSCKNFNCLKCDAVHNSSCQVYQRQILDGADEAKKTALLAKLSKGEIAIHDLVRKGTVESYSEAEKFLVLRAKYENYKDSDLVWAIRQSNEMSVIERSLNIECNFCNETFSHNNIFGMITCEHTFCMDCAKTNFTIQIKEKTIRDCICPTCKLPDLNNSSDEDEYFSLMGALLKNILDENIYDLFDRKTRDRALRVELAAYEDRKLAHILKTMPNSRQCKTLKCKNYFIVKDDSCTRYQCQSCKNFNCLKCDAVHNSSCQVYQRQILDGADEAKKTALLAKLSKEEIAIHDLVRKGTVESYSEAEKFLVLRAKYENYKDSDLVWAIRQSNEMSVIERSLNIECNFCNETFSHNNIFGMITCEHTFCIDCAKTYFTIQIKEKTIRDCICPTCKLPDLNNSSDEDEYFSLMGALLKNILDENIYDLFDRKTRDRALRVELAAYEDRKLAHILKTMPNSRQCKTLKCKNYFIVKDDSCTRYQCQSCKNFNCLKCDAVHNSSCQVYQRQILDGADEAKKTALLAKLSKEEIAIHDLVRKGTVESYSEAEKFLVLRAKYENYKDSDLVWAIRQSNEMSVIERSLNIECNFCNETFSHNNIFGMITCEHTFCMDCAKTHFTIQIKEKTIRDCICPTCKLPVLNNSSDEDEYFSLMGALLKNILDENIYDLFDRKTRDRALLLLPNFVWCVKCEYGFEVNQNRINAACTECNSEFCITCNEPWQEQHAGITCQQFKQWKEENDPKNQSEGVANYLSNNGIDCPECKFKYSLAKGGCLHFTCSQCSHQFCFGCRKPMIAGAKCTKFNDCATKGLHAHHPRNCLTVLRDCEIASLEGLLTKFNVNFTGIPQNGAVCQIPIQRETPGKMIDCLCEKATVNEKIGLCEQHYKEGLVDLIFKSKIDPVDILDLGEAKAELIRNHVAEPVRLTTDNDVTYREKCIIAIKTNIPLNLGA